jgi:hypothetical protein
MGHELTCPIFKHHNIPLIYQGEKIKIILNKEL